MTVVFSAHRNNFGERERERERERDWSWGLQGGFSQTKRIKNKKQRWEKSTKGEKRKQEAIMYSSLIFWFTHHSSSSSSPKSIPHLFEFLMFYLIFCLLLSWFFLIEEIKQWRVLSITATMVGFQEEHFLLGKKKNEPQDSSMLLIKFISSVCLESVSFIDKD